jgi:spore germination protein KA
VGQAISIVGALVMGQAAIQAGLVGAPVVILIALTGVASFAVPNLANAVSMIRWLLLILAAVLGGYGLTLGLIIALVHLSSLKSFGTPILAPIAPLNPPDLKDTFWRAPLWWMRTRPAALHPMDIQRQSGERPNFEQDANPENPKGGGKA